MREKYTLDDLDDIGTEIQSISEGINIISNLVEPKAEAVRGIYQPTDGGIDSAFYAMTTHLDRIAATLSELWLQYIKTKEKTA